MLFVGVLSQTAPSSAQAWCSPGAKLNVLWGGTWFPATVKNVAPGGKCLVGYDGWSKTWDQAITAEMAAPPGSKVTFAKVPEAPQPPLVGGPVLMGIYECTEPNGMPNLAMMFGLLDGTTYTNTDSKTGSYKFNQGSGMLTMISGPLAGDAFQRNPRGTSFLLYHSNDGHRPALNCPRNPVKDPRHHPW